MSSSLSSRIGLRPIDDGDLPFLERLYASTREEELAVLDWSEEEKGQFLRQQFEAQHRFYQEQFPDAQFSILALDDEPIGRLYVHRRPDEIRLIDIALLPEYRGRGIGTPLLRSLLDEAAASQRCVRIHVEQFNRALRLYERLGFRKVEDQGVYYLMEWSADSGAIEQEE